MEEINNVVIRFSGDSGDGMQLTGTQFSNTSALMGNDISTFPDYPSEIRAPIGTVAGVSGFQVHIGSGEVNTPGDEADVLVAMNPAAIKANIHSLKKGGALIVNLDSFDERNLQRAGYSSNPLENGELSDIQIIQTKITSQTLEALKEIDLDNKSKERCKNFYALGLCYFIYGRDLLPTQNWIKNKFKGKEALINANTLSLNAGFHYGETIQASVSTYKVPKAKITPGKYRQINGNTSTALGLIRASEVSGRPLFLGSYPITPASDILHELAKHKNLGVKTFQAEDEIAGICTSIGASFGGALGVTTSSGPGIALKMEAMGLAMIYELPLVIVNVQRGGPSTGLPTKTEQSDLNQALYGRNGESPLIVIAASRPNDCFGMAFEAARLTLEHMTPVVLLTDGYIANGSEPWKLPDLDKSYTKINTHLVNKTMSAQNFQPYSRDENLVRPWAIPGMEGFEHRIGGLEKSEGTGNVDHSPKNHEKMTALREQKVQNVANFIPLQEIEGDKTGDLLVISWGGTYGATSMAVKELQKEGKKVSLAHLKYINPLPKNIEQIIKGFKKIIVPELNNGQLKSYINGKFGCNAIGYNKIQGLPFKISELVNAFHKELENNQ